jgi:hypothetical protein
VLFEALVLAVLADPVEEVQDHTFFLLRDAI